MGKISTLSIDRLENQITKMNRIVDKIRAELRKKSDEKTRKNSQRFFKEKLKSYGVNNPTVNKLSKEYFKLIDFKTKAEIFDLCEIFWKSGYIEESFIACHWSYFIRKKYEPEDFEIFEKWIHEYVNNWASCDTFCNHTLGEFIERYPEYLARLKDFAKSDNRWMRRAAAVTLIKPAGKGKFLSEILEIADILLLDKEDLVQKGYGWLLKSAGKANQQAIVDYVMKNKSVMPRTALRYAIEKMPKELKIKAMER